MRWFSIIMIYGLFWVLAAFVVMPFGLRPAHLEDDAEMVAGQEESAPVNFRPGMIALRATIVSAIAFGLFYANYKYGWVTFADIDFTRLIKE